MKRRFSTITVEAEVYLYDVISEIDTEDLIDELKSRKAEEVEKLLNKGLKEIIEADTNRIIESLSNNEICRYVLKKLNRL